MTLDISSSPEEEVRALYEVNGYSISEIAVILNRPISTIHRMARRAGVKLRSRSEAMRLKRANDAKRLVDIPETELRHLYEELRLPTTAIARKYDCSPGTVQNRLRQFGIRLSLPGRARVDISAHELEDLYIKERLSLRQVAKRLDCDHSTVRNKLTDFSLRARSYSEANQIYPRHDFTGDLCDKAYLIGFRLGDLYVSTLGSDNSTIVINCGTTKQDQIDLITSLFQPYGHVQIGKPNHKGCAGITCYLNPTFDFLLPKADAVPSWIQADAHCSLSFAAGYIDAEGSFFLTGNEARFAVSSYDKNILHWLHGWFIGLGIECRPPYKAGKEGAIRPNGTIYRKDVWTLSVTRKQFLLHLTNLIKPFLKHAKRKRDAQLAKANVEARLRKKA